MYGYVGYHRYTCITLEPPADMNSCMSTFPSPKRSLVNSCMASIALTVAFTIGNRAKTSGFEGSSKNHLQV